MGDTVGDDTKQHNYLCLPGCGDVSGQRKLNYILLKKELPINLMSYTQGNDNIYRKFDQTRGHISPCHQKIELN